MDMIKEEKVDSTAMKRKPSAHGIDDKKEDHFSDSESDSDSFLDIDEFVHRAAKAVKRDGPLDTIDHQQINPLLLPVVVMDGLSSLELWSASYSLYERACSGNTEALSSLLSMGSRASNEALVFYVLHMCRSDAKSLPSDFTSTLIQWLQYHLDRIQTSTEDVMSLSVEESKIMGFFHAVLGVSYLKGIGGLSVDYQTAIHHFQHARYMDDHGQKIFVAAFVAHYLAVCYSEGENRDEEEAFRLFTWAATSPQNFVLSQARLARAYETGLGINKDLLLAAHWHRAAAVQGYVASQYELGRLLHSRKLNQHLVSSSDNHTTHTHISTTSASSSSSLKTFASNEEEAYHWFSQAAMEFQDTSRIHGEPKAQVMLGYYYEHGLGGVSVDHERALFWYLQAASQGEPTAQQNVGVCYEKGIGLPNNQPNLALASKYFGKAARKGLLSAIYRRGYAYHYGRGIEQNFRKAAFWYRQGYARKHAESTYSLALLYRYGQGVDRQDLIEAARLTLLSAELGSLSGMCYMGVICGRGQGVVKDPVAEFRWYTQAAERGYALAQYYLGNIYFNGSVDIPVGVDYSAAIHWFQLSAENGESQAQKKLAFIYEQGRGVPVDLALAQHWKQRAQTSSSSSSSANRSKAANHSNTNNADNSNGPTRRLVVVKHENNGSSNSSNTADNMVLFERQRREELERRRIEASIDDLVTAMPSLLSLE